MKHPPRPSFRPRPVPWLGAALLILGAGACGGDAKGTDPNSKASDPAGSNRGTGMGNHPAEQVVLIVDGMEITAGEVHEFDEGIRAYDPIAGQSTLTRYVLASHVLPLRAAQRSFADQRAKAHGDATAYHDAIQGNSIVMLRETGTTRGGYEAERKPLGNLSLPMQRWAVAKENVYAISPVLEVPEGFQVVSVAEVHDALSTAVELFDIYVVPFVTLSKQEHDTWWSAERARLSTLCTWVHDDYRHVLPTWLNPPPPQ